MIKLPENSGFHSTGPLHRSRGPTPLVPGEFERATSVPVHDKSPPPKKEETFFSGFPLKNGFFRGNAREICLHSWF